MLKLNVQEKFFDKPGVMPFPIGHVVMKKTLTVHASQAAMRGCGRIWHSGPDAGGNVETIF